MYEFSLGQKKMMRAAWEIYRVGTPSGREVIPLERGVESPPVFLIPGERQIFKVDVQGVTGDVSCETSGEEGQLNLFVNMDAAPSFTSKDCCTSGSSSPNQACGRMETTKRGHLLTLLCQFPLFSWMCSSTKTCTEVESPSFMYAGVMATGPQAVQGLTVRCGEA